MSGSAGLFNKTKFFFNLVGSPKVGGAGDGKHKKNTATLMWVQHVSSTYNPLLYDPLLDYRSTMIVYINGK